MRNIFSMAPLSGALLISLAGATALAQPATSGGGGGHGWRTGHAPSADGIDGSLLPWVLVAVCLAVTIAVFVRARRAKVVSSAVSSTNEASRVPTFALRAVSGVLTWLGGLAAVLGLLAGTVIIIAGLAAEQGVLGLLGGAVPAIVGGVVGLVVMAVGQLLACITAIEAHARSVAERVAANVEETARLRAVVMGRLPSPSAGTEAEATPTNGGAASQAHRAAI